MQPSQTSTVAALTTADLTPRCLLQAETGILTGEHAAVEAELATLLHIAPMHRSNQRLVAAIAYALLRLHRCGTPTGMA